MFRLIKIWKNLSEIKKAKIKRKAVITSLITTNVSTFFIGGSLWPEILNYLNGKPAVAWALTSTGITLLILLIIGLGAKRFLRPLKEKREQRMLDLELKRKELEKKE